MIEETYVLGYPDVKKKRHQSRSYAKIDNSTLLLLAVTCISYCAYYFFNKLTYQSRHPNHYGTLSTGAIKIITESSTYLETCQGLASLMLWAAKSSVFRVSAEAFNFEPSTVKFRDRPKVYKQAIVSGVVFAVVSALTALHLGLKVYRWSRRSGDDQPKEKTN